MNDQISLNSTLNNENTTANLSKSVRSLSIIPSESKYTIRVPRQILLDSGIITLSNQHNIDPKVGYFIKQVYDSETRKYVPIWTGIELGLYDTKTSEYIDSETGNALKFALAIRRKKVKLIQLDLNQDEIQEETEGNKNDGSILEDPIKQIVLNVGNNNNNINKFNLPKELYYRKPINNKFIKFEDCIRKNNSNHQIYDRLTGKFKDMYSNEAYTINEALQKGILRIRSQRILFDLANIYLVDSITLDGGNRKLGLNEAVEAKLINRQKCTFMLPNERSSGTVFSIKEAMRRGFIEGKIYTSLEIKNILDDFVSKIIELHHNDESPRRDEKNHENDDDEVKSLDKFDAFYIYDSEQERYIRISEAFYKGILLNDPIRVRDPTNGNYILLRDACVKGLLSTNETLTSKKIDFKNRTSFLTHNHLTYLIDYVCEVRKKARYSLLEATRKGLYLNGMYRNLYKNEQLSLDDALKNGYIVGNQIDLDRVDSLFKQLSMHLPDKPPKPSRGIFATENNNNNNNSNNNEKHLTVVARNRSSSERSKKTVKSAATTIDSSLDYNSDQLFMYSNNNAIETQNELEIESIYDPVKRENFNLEQAIHNGLFDIHMRMYNDLKNQRKLTLIEAVDQNLIKIKQNGKFLFNYYIKLS
jgi:hypothetical protein